jgi:hypothetical protein
MGGGDREEGKGPGVGRMFVGKEEEEEEMRKRRRN